MPQRFFKQESKVNWFEDTQYQLNDARIQLGAILRIADATELMAKNYVALQEEADRYKRYYQQEQGYNKDLRLSNAALKGQITKLKKRLAGSIASEGQKVAHDILLGFAALDVVKDGE